MKPTMIRILAAAFASCAIAACSREPAPSAPAKSDPAPAATALPTTLSLIPQPAEVVLGKGSFRIDAKTPMHAYSREAQAVAMNFAENLINARGFSPEPVNLRTNAIEFAIDQAATDDDEGYLLEITTDGIKVSARTERGLFYGGVTLWQLATNDTSTDKAAIVPALTIRDRPRYAWRGLMLDSARHYQSPEFIERLLRTMSLHKLNTLHWHLTDDQGWRIEIKKYPKLTEIGAWSVPPGPAAAADIDPATGQPRRYGGYYTQDEIRHLVSYAQSLHIDIVPEIDMPGHMQAAIASYPALGTGEKPPVSVDWGVHTYLLNVEDSTFEFIDNVLEEVTALFPSRYIHVGGDEAAKDRWEASPAVQAKLKALGLKDETALQGWFLERVEAMLEKRQRKLIGWDEILESKLPEGTTVMSWRGTKGAVEAARHGHDVVLAPAPELYINNLQSLADGEPPARLDALVTLESLYGFEPTPAELTPDEARHVLGAQVNLWTEHMRTDAMIEHAIFPRLAALAELDWSPAAARDWPGFVKRLPAQFERYRALGVGYADSAFRVQAAVDAGKVTLSAQVKTGEIRYTLDGSEPTMQSTSYQAPFDAGAATAVRASVFVDGQRMAQAPAVAIDEASQRVRTSATLKQCRDKGLMLRLEDDAPLQGPRAYFSVDIFDACWIWPQAPLDGVKRIAADVGNLPYNFQLWRDIKSVVVRKPAQPDGELEVYLDSCEGKPWTTVPLTAAKAQVALTTLSTDIPATQGKHDLCFRFTRSGPEVLWALDKVKLEK